MTGGPAIVTGIARGDTEVYEVSPAALRRLLNDHPELGDVILRAFIARRHLLQESGEFVGLRVIGSGHSPETFRVREFLAKNHVPFTWFDTDTDPEVSQLLRALRGDRGRHARGGLGAQAAAAQALDPASSPTPWASAGPWSEEVYDLVVVGGGPAGLAAAVYGASEGLKTVVLESTAPGGQAGRSMRIENYLGFPTGITGAELAERAVVQANKFGASPARRHPGHRTGIRRRTCRAPHRGRRAGQGPVPADRHRGRISQARRRRGASGSKGCGVYYAATPMEAQMCRGSEVVVVGGGNSAGQAAVYLAGQVRKVYLVIRGNDLYEHMSSYLADRIKDTPNIEVLLNTEVTAMHGDGYLELGRAREPEDGRGADHPDPGTVQLHRGGAADRLAARRDRAGREGVHPDGDGPGAGPPPGQRPESVPAGDQPARRVRRRRRAIRLDQAGRVGRRRGGDGRPVRARVPQGDRGGSPPARTDPSPGRETQPRPVAAGAEHG